MWSVWAEAAEIYLCRGVIWWRDRARGVQRLQVPSTLPLHLQLQKVQDALNLPQGKSRKLRVYLGANLCPPVCFSPPAELRQKEQLWLAQKMAAKTWGVDPAQLSQLECELSSIRGLAAAMPQALLEVIRAWAGKVGMEVVSVAPMWSYFSRDALRNKGEVFAMLEPDGLEHRLKATEQGCLWLDKAALAEGATGAARFLRWLEPKADASDPKGPTSLLSCFSVTSQ